MSRHLLWDVFDFLLEKRSNFTYKLRQNSFFMGMYKNELPAIE